MAHGQIHRSFDLLKVAISRCGWNILNKQRNKETNKQTYFMFETDQHSKWSRQILGCCFPSTLNFHGANAIPKGYLYHLPLCNLYTLLFPIWKGWSWSELQETTNLATFGKNSGILQINLDKLPRPQQPVSYIKGCDGVACWLAGGSRNPLTNQPTNQSIKSQLGMPSKKTSGVNLNNHVNIMSTVITPIPQSTRNQWIPSSLKSSSERSVEDFWEAGLLQTPDMGISEAKSPFCPDFGAWVSGGSRVRVR